MYSISLCKILSLDSSVPSCKARLLGYSRDPLISCVSCMSEIDLNQLFILISLSWSDTYIKVL